MPTLSPTLTTDLAHRVEAFEAALAADPAADPTGFLPPPGHPLHAPVLGEVVRVHLEHAWANGTPTRLAGYTARFPALLEHPELLAAVAFEEYRQRRRAGESVDPAEYRAKYAVDTAGWPDVVPASAAGGDDLPGTEQVIAAPPSPASLAADESADDGGASRWREAAAALPEPGTTFLGFRLVEELGRGAFGRVYFAKQGDLAGRPVALKVAGDAGDESQTLAQLQHPNVVPIHSFHKAGPFQAVCMPYLGRTTLADVLRQLSGRGGMPSSGRELRSTLNRKKDATLSAVPPSADAPAADPVPAAEPTQPTTPDGWSKLERLTYVEAVLTLAMQLADGLAHAHDRGILHRDLKPANVLLADDGRPVLLDFNLAEDVKTREAAGRAAVGGTLPYMAPEHMEAFGNRAGRADERCDVYGLGVILFELLTGRRPFPDRKGSPRQTIPVMAADRRQPLPSIRALNRAVSPAVESVVRKCLAPDPAARYQRAADLREDLERHLQHRPLRHAPDPSARERVAKWARRHPRLSSSATVGTAAAVLLAAAVGGAVVARDRARGLEARTRLHDHDAAFRDAREFLDDRTRSWTRMDEGADRLRGVLTRYDVPDDPAAAEAWFNGPALRHLPAADRDRVTADVGEAFYLLAQAEQLRGIAATDPAARAAHADKAARWTELAAKYAADRLPRAVKVQRAAVADLLGDRDGAAKLRAEAATTPAETARDLYLAGKQLASQNRHRAALELLRRSTRLDPSNFSAWMTAGGSHLAVGQAEFAAVAFGAAVALRPDFAPAWMNRGVAFARLRKFPHARDDYDQALKLDPQLTEAYLLRSEAREALGDKTGAAADLDAALATGGDTARVHFVRSNFRARHGDAAGAAADRAAGYALPATTELAWLARSENRPDDAPAAALADAEEALKLNPFSVYALQQKAHLLSEGLKRPADAVAVLDRLVLLHPDHAPAWAGRGILHARAGDRAAAHRDAAEALRLDPTGGPNVYQVAGVFALTSKAHPADRAEALRLLWLAFRTGDGLDDVDTDPDLALVRGDREFQELVSGAKAVHRRRNSPAPGAEK
jgi:serine/threonine protein kinase/tetratricopeptide (TPR) repeat protein